MIFTSIAQYVAFILPFASAAGKSSAQTPREAFLHDTVLDPRPMSHIIENVKPRYGGRRGLDPIPVKNGTATTTSSSARSTITSAPWPSYSTSFCQMDFTITTDYCRVHPGTVQVHFWPTGAAAGNRSYPSTYYYSELDVTM